MFGLGITELLILLIVGTIVIGVPIAIVVLVVVLLSKQKDAHGDGQLVSQLRTENQRLREELAAINATMPSDGSTPQ